jgi:phage tail-like protein
VAVHNDAYADPLAAFPVRVELVGRGSGVSAAGFGEFSVVPTADVPTVRLLRGMLVDAGLTHWLRDRAGAPRDLRVTLVDESGVRLGRWRLPSSFPVRVESADLPAAADEVIIEELLLTTDGVEIDRDNDDPS